MNSGDAADGSHAHPFCQERKDTASIVNARRVVAKRILARFRERRAAGAATVAWATGFRESESLGGSVFALSTGHDRPLASQAGRADNRFGSGLRGSARVVWIAPVAVTSGGRGVLLCAQFMVLVYVSGYV